VCRPGACGTVGNPTFEQAISWNPNDIGGGETARARCTENSMTGVMQWLPSAGRRSEAAPARLTTILAACIGRIRANTSQAAPVGFVFYS
jgi:hypothetical protein